ncbi:hypothetical protein ACIHEJ_05290, partial [Streptomyces sp. NPDC052301]
GGGDPENTDRPSGGGGHSGGGEGGGDPENGNRPSGGGGREGALGRAGTTVRGGIGLPGTGDIATHLSPSAPEADGGFNGGTFLSGSGGG